VIILLIFVGALGIIVGLLVALLIVRLERRDARPGYITNGKYASEREIRQVEREAENS
jgi:uncharacterized membrane-anchored protein YhcB (DUF1043 family)